MNGLAMGSGGDRTAQADDLLTIAEIEQAAIQNLTREVYDYAAGGGGRETTVRRNREALERILFRPRILRDVAGRSTATTFRPRLARPSSAPAGFPKRMFFPRRESCWHKIRELSEEDP